MPEIGIRAGVGAVVNGGAELLKQWYAGNGYNVQDIAAASIGGAAGGIVQGLLPTQVAGTSGAVGTVVTGIVERGLDSDLQTDSFDTTAMAGDAAAGAIADQFARPISKLFKKQANEIFDDAANRVAIQAQSIIANAPGLADYALREAGRELREIQNYTNAVRETIEKSIKNPFKDIIKDIHEPVEAPKKVCSKGKGKCTEVTMTLGPEDS